MLITANSMGTDRINLSDQVGSTVESSTAVATNLTALKISPSDIKSKFLNQI